MWETLKKQLVDKIIIEVKSKNNWEIIKQFIGNEKIDEICGILTELIVENSK